MQNAATATLVITPPAVILIVNPYLFYTSMAVLMFTCFVVCAHIIIRCKKREVRLDAVLNRAMRRANAKRDTECSKDCREH